MACTWIVIASNVTQSPCRVLKVDLNNNEEHIVDLLHLLLRQNDLLQTMKHHVLFSLEPYGDSLLLEDALSKYSPLEKRIFFLRLGK